MLNCCVSVSSIFVGISLLFWSSVSPPPQSPTDVMKISANNASTQDFPRPKNMNVTDKICQMLLEVCYPCMNNWDSLIQDFSLQCYLPKLSQCYLSCDSKSWQYPWYRPVTAFYYAIKLVYFFYSNANHQMLNSYVKAFISSKLLFKKSFYNYDLQSFNGG